MKISNRGSNIKVSLSTKINLLNFSDLLILISFIFFNGEENELQRIKGCSLDC